MLSFGLEKIMKEALTEAVKKMSGIGPDISGSQDCLPVCSDNPFEQTYLIKNDEGEIVGAVSDDGFGNLQSVPIPQQSSALHKDVYLKKGEDVHDGYAKVIEETEKQINLGVFGEPKMAMSEGSLKIEMEETAIVDGGCQVFLTPIENASENVCINIQPITDGVEVCFAQEQPVTFIPIVPLIDFSSLATVKAAVNSKGQSNGALVPKYSAALYSASYEDGQMPFGQAPSLVPIFLTALTENFGQGGEKSGLKVIVAQMPDKNPKTSEALGLNIVGDDLLWQKVENDAKGSDRNKSLSEEMLASLRREVLTKLKKDRPIQIAHDSRKDSEKIKKVKLDGEVLHDETLDPYCVAISTATQGGPGAAMAAPITRDSGTVAQVFKEGLDESGMRVGKSSNQGESHEGGNHSDENSEDNEQDAAESMLA